MSATPEESLDLEPIEARLNAATPGPWWLLNEYTEPHQDGDEWHIYARVGNRVPRVVDNTEDQLTWPDAEFIAHAPTDVAALIAEVRRLRDEMEGAANLGFLAGARAASHGDPTKAEIDSAITAYDSYLRRYVTPARPRLKWSLNDDYHLLHRRLVPALQEAAAQGQGGVR